MPILIYFLLSQPIIILPKEPKLLSCAESFWTEGNKILINIVHIVFVPVGYSI